MPTQPVGEKRDDNQTTEYGRRDPNPKPKSKSQETQSKSENTMGKKVAK
ncbi:hypothetical protein [Thalassobacillus sp. C254]|nr:hypothetical protein [Thalassobacillus sp. C254]